MGILLVYDVTDEASFNNIRNWMRNIEAHASDSVNKILVGNKSDMGGDERRAVPFAKGQALADEFGVRFFETSAKDNSNVEEAFTVIAKDVMARLAREQADQQQASTAAPLKLTSGLGKAGKARARSRCCDS